MIKNQSIEAFSKPGIVGIFSDLFERDGARSVCHTWLT